jgi:hypothetical protein
VDKPVDNNGENPSYHRATWQETMKTLQQTRSRALGLKSVVKIFKGRSRGSLGLISPQDDYEDCIVSYLSMAERVKKAFLMLPANATEVKALRAVIDHPGATHVELSKVCNWMPTSWRTHMVVACQSRRDVIWPQGFPKKVTTEFLLSALVSYRPETMGFWMNPEIQDFFKNHLKAPVQSPSRLFAIENDKNPNGQNSLIFDDIIAERGHRFNHFP